MPRKDRIMELTDICTLEKWMELEQRITAMSGLGANVFNTKGHRITAYRHWSNRLCPAIKATDKGQSFICAVAHMNIAAQAQQTQQEVVEECDAGLLKVVVPVFVKGEFLGTICACGLLLENGEVDPFLINKITDIEEEEIETLSNDIRKLKDEKIRELCDFIRAESEKIIASADNT